MLLLCESRIEGDGGIRAAAGVRGGGGACCRGTSGAWGARDRSRRRQKGKGVRSQRSFLVRPDPPPPPKTNSYFSNFHHGHLFYHPRLHLRSQLHPSPRRIHHTSAVDEAVALWRLRRDARRRRRRRRRGRRRRERRSGGISEGTFWKAHELPRRSGTPTYPPSKQEPKGLSEGWNTLLYKKGRISFLTSLP